MVSLIEVKRKGKVQMVHTCQNHKRHIPLVSLLLWHKIVVAIRLFICPLALQQWSGRGGRGRQAGR